MAAVSAGLALASLALFSSPAGARRGSCPNGTSGLRLALVPPGRPIPIGTGSPLVRAQMAGRPGLVPSWAVQLRAIDVSLNGRRVGVTTTELGPGLFRVEIPRPTEGSTYSLSGLEVSGDVSFGPATDAPAAPALAEVAGYESRRSHGGVNATEVRLTTRAPAGVMAVLIYEDGGASARTWLPISAGAREATQRGGTPMCAAVPPNTVTTVRSGRSVRAAWLMTTGVVSARSAPVVAQPLRR